MKEQVQLFLTIEDEIALSNRLCELRPGVLILDGNRWDSTVPKIARSIDKCETNYAYLWDKNILSELPYFSRGDGQFEGPQTGCVFEIWRSRLRENLLLAGRFAQCIGHTDPLVVAAMYRFADDVWKLLKKMTKHPLVAVDPISLQVVRDPVPEYRAGDGAIEWALKSPKNLLATHTVNVFFKPK